MNIRNTSLIIVTFLLVGISTVSTSANTSWVENFDYSDGVVPENIDSISFGGIVRDLNVQNGKLKAEFLAEADAIFDQ
jgi:hypothetical protein